VPTPTTDRAKVRALFRKLRSAGVYARMSHYERKGRITRDLRLDGIRPGRAIVYYPPHDNDAFDGDGTLVRGLDLRFGILPATGNFGDPLNQARDRDGESRLGQQVVELAEEVGLNTLWDGDTFTCIILKAKSEG